MLLRIVQNSRAQAVVPQAASGAESLAFHRRLAGYAPSRLLGAPGIAALLGVGTVWVKDESERLGLPAFKILGASWAAYTALAARFGPFAPWETLDDLAAQLQPHGPLTLAAATDGNHGRAVARIAKLCGLHANIYVPQGTAQARIDAIASEGAQVTVVDGTYDDAVARSAADAGPRCLVISDTSWPGYEDVPRQVIAGYGTIFAEADAQLAAQGAAPIDLVAVQIGVGALAAALVGHYRRADVPHPPLIVGVEPLRAACLLASIEAGAVTEVPGPHDSIMAGLNCGAPSLVAWPAVSTGVDLFVAVGDEFACAGMRALAAEGVVAGETGAAGLAGLLALLHGPAADEHRTALKLTANSSVLLIITEGATDPDNYERIVHTNECCSNNLACWKRVKL